MGCWGDNWREHSPTLLVVVVHNRDVTFVTSKFRMVVGVERGQVESCLFVIVDGIIIIVVVVVVIVVVVIVVVVIVVVVIVVVAVGVVLFSGLIEDDGGNLLLIGIAEL